MLPQPPNGPMPQLALNLPQVCGFDVAGASLFRYAAGGDYHDFFVHEEADGCMAVAVGDVAGHDPDANRLMVRVREVLRTSRAEAGRLAQLMGLVNRDLSGRAKAGRFMTLFLAVLGAGDRSIHWVSAGHDGAIAFDPQDDRFVEVAGEDIPLGIDPDWRYHELDHTGWRRGSMLVVGTDGIWESRNPAGQMYGKGRLRRLLRQVADQPSCGIVEAVTEDLDRFRDGEPQRDDVTLVVIKAV